MIKRNDPNVIAEGILARMDASRVKYNGRNWPQIDKKIEELRALRSQYVLKYKGECK